MALPVAVRKKMGVIAMKIYAQEGLTGEAPPEKLLYYSLSLPVSLAVVGNAHARFHRTKRRSCAKAFKPLPKSEMQEMSGRLAAKHKMALDRRFANHRDV